MTVAPRLRPILAALAALGPLAAGSCADQGTELVLTIRTDFHVPEEVDQLWLSVHAPAPPEGGAPYDWEQSYALGGDPDEHGMPATLALRPGPNNRRDVTFQAELRKDGVAIARGGASGSFEDGRRVDTELRVDRVDSFACPNDPADGAPEDNIGGPCASSADCDGNFCLAASLFPGFPGGYCLGQSSLSVACDPLDGASCVLGSSCIQVGTGSPGVASHLCLDACAVAGSRGLAHRTNCDCRDGYACDSVGGVCLPGCSTDDECCRLWTDADGDTFQDPGEWTPVDGCRGSCDLASSRCEYDGAPGATIGSPCLHENDCPTDSRCVSEALYGLPGGMCIRDRCDLEGHECDAGSGCANLAFGYWACLRGCEVGSGPSGSGFRCESGQACWPGEFSPAPSGFGDADGYCWVGNWSSITVHNVYSPCTQPADCWSPFGLGDCLQPAPGAPGYCIVHGCGHPDVASTCTEGGGGVCAAALDHCAKGCTPGLEPAAAGCPAGFACWSYGGVGFCHLPCDDSADCGSAWTCNGTSHGCEG
ncbi:MAG: hypothetical protein JXB32_07845 [Deltaproteobacteria bacterium]|nr:hypothetical protein [Deltaproteobacteria bacterium]